MRVLVESASGLNRLLNLDLSLSKQTTNYVLHDLRNITYSTILLASMMFYFIFISCTSSSVVAASRLVVRVQLYLKTIVFVSYLDADDFTEAKGHYYEHV